VALRPVGLSDQRWLVGRGLVACDGFMLNRQVPVTTGNAAGTGAAGADAGGAANDGESGTSIGLEARDRVAAEVGAGGPNVMDSQNSSTGGKCADAAGADGDKSGRWLTGEVGADKEERAAEAEAKQPVAGHPAACAAVAAQDPVTRRQPFAADEMARVR